MAYSAVVAADNPVAWYRLTEGGGFSASVGSSPGNLYAYGNPPTMGFTGIARDGGSVALPNGAGMEAQPTALITALSGYSMEGWIFVQGAIPFNPAVTDYPLQFFIDSANGFQIGATASTRIATARDPSHTSNSATGASALSYGWHHLCATRPAGGTTALQLYVDGTLVGSSSAYTNFGVNEPVRVNLISTPTPVSLFVAEPAVYFSELSSSRVAAHAAAADITHAPTWSQHLLSCS